MPLYPPLPNDFPEEPYLAIQKRLSVDLGEAHPEARREFAGGWNALRYRYLACSEHDHEFIELIRRNQADPDRYGQERALYGFFVSGQSAIESLCYALYAIASVVRPSDFGLGAQQLKDIKWYKTAKSYGTFFPGDALTIALAGLDKSSEFTEWRDQRNILTHRATPGRNIKIGGSKDGLIEWSGIVLNEETTSVRRHWLSTVMGSLLRSADSFTAKQLPNL